jgi:hypothetical protein
MTYRTDMTETELYELQNNLEQYLAFMTDVIKPMAQMASAQASEDLSLTLYRCIGISRLPDLGETFQSILPTSWTRKIDFAQGWCRTAPGIPVVYKARFSLYAPILLFSREKKARPTRSARDIPYNQGQDEVMVAPGILTVTDIKKEKDGIHVITLDASNISWENLQADVKYAIDALPIEVGDTFNTEDEESVEWEMPSRQA